VHHSSATWCRPGPQIRTRRPTVMHRDRHSHRPRHPKHRHAMPPAPLAGNAVTGTREQAAAPGTRAAAPVTSGHGPRNTRALLPRRAARRAQTALPDAARSDTTGSARAETRGDRLRRIADQLWRAPKTNASCHDPLFERPDLIEDDYYRLRNQPHGW
jgi:hypothetical protein